MTAPARSPLACAFDEALLRDLTPAIERLIRDLPSAEVKVLRLRFGIGASRLSQGGPYNCAFRIVRDRHTTSLPWGITDRSGRSGPF